MSAAVFWPVWFLAIFWLTLEPLRWLLAQYGSLGWIAILGVVFGGVYIWLRGRGPWKWEPPILFAVCILAMLVRFQGVIVVALVFGAMFALGARLLDRFGLREQASIALCCAVGIAALAPLLFALGMAGWLYLATFDAILLAIFSVCFAQARTLPVEVASLWKKWVGAEELRDPLAGIAICALALATGLTLLMTVTPPIAWDPIHMHLLEARYYAAQHAVKPVPDLDYSYFPNGYEAFATMLVSLGSIPAAQLSSGVFFALTSLTCIRLLRALDCSRLAAFVGGSVAATIPAFHWSSSVAKNDAMLLLFEWSALECFLLWRSSGNEAWTIVGALVLAAAASVKLTAIFGIIPLALLLLYGAWRGRRRWRTVVGVGVILVALGSYWPVRTYLLKGSPTYPQIASVASPIASIPGSDTPWPLSTLERYGQIFWNLHFVSKGTFERPLPNPLAFSFLLFAPVWLVYRKAPTFAMKSVAVFLGMYLLYWAHTYPVIRYGLPAVALLFALTAARAVDGAAKAAKVPMWAAFAYSFGFAVLGCAYIGMNRPQVSWALGRISDRDYLREAVEGYSASEFLAKHAAEGDRVLGLEYYASLYTPGKVRITAMSLDDQKQIPAEFLALVQAGGYDWLVVPLSASPKLNASGTPVYEDPRFVILEHGK